jgi:hypothetical protein
MWMHTEARLANDLKSDAACPVKDINVLGVTFQFRCNSVTKLIEKNLKGAWINMWWCIPCMLLDKTLAPCHANDWQKKQGWATFVTSDDVHLCTGDKPRTKQQDTTSMPTKCACKTWPENYLICPFMRGEREKKTLESITGWIYTKESLNKPTWFFVEILIFHKYVL